MEGNNLLLCIVDFDISSEIVDFRFNETLSIQYSASKPGLYTYE